MVYIYGEGTAAEYSLTQALHNTGNQQVVWFEPDVYLLNAISQGSSGDGASIIFAFSNATYKSGGPQGAPTAAYSNCYWYGNGLTLDGANIGTNYAIQVDVTGPLNGGTAVAFDCELGGFNLINIAGGALLCATYNGHGSQPTDLQSNHNIRFFQITAKFSASTVQNNSGIPVGINSCNRIVLEDLDIDCSAYPSVDYSNPFVWSAQGTCHDIIFRRCHFKGNGVSGQVPELQGSAVSGGQPNSSVTSKILMEDCIFDSGASSVVLAGSGGGFLDDNNGSGNSAVITDVEFLRCSWINCGVTYQNNGATSFFGYVRFRDCRNMPGAFSGSLVGRGPTTNSPVTITVGASPFSYPPSPSAADPFDVEIIVQGGTVTEIDINGVKTGVTAGSFRIRPVDQLTVKYTSVPTMNKIAQ
jgi:hypothetical protein